jgi:hypothetical protein
MCGAGCDVLKSINGFKILRQLEGPNVFAMLHEERQFEFGTD